MKYKIYDYSNNSKILEIKNSEIFSSFEIQKNEGLSVEEIIKKKYDIIEFAGSEYDEFVKYIPAVDWKTSQIASADCLIFKNKIHKPYNILAETIIEILKKNVNRINSQLPVIVIGENHFISGVVIKLALSGFVEIIVSPVNSEISALKALEKKIKSFVFNLNMKIVPIGDITSVDQNAFLMISNFPKEKNEFAYEQLIYFNYLAEAALFIDCNSINDSNLVEDARKAEIFVIDEVAVLENKYNYLRELLKISP